MQNASPPSAGFVDEPAEVLAHERGRKVVVAGGDGGVRREHRPQRDLPVGRREADAPRRGPPPGELDRREGTVALVQVEDAGVDAERVQHPHAADAEDQLLTQPGDEVAAVELCGDRAQLGGVPIDVGVE